MLSTILLATSLSAAVASAQDVLGVYIFHRHGDRTAKAWKPVNLTPLGADEVYSSGQFFRSRYIDSGASSLRIAGLSQDPVVLSQIAVTATVDNVLQNSALVFLQGLYPPSTSAGAETLANGSTVEAPLGGYQAIPVNAVASAATAQNAESSAWLQGNSGCGNAVVSSNNYFLSPEYAQTYNQSYDFYQSLLPVINTTFNAGAANFKNGYSIFDYINVAEIHNSSIPSKDLLTNATLSELYDLASTHEWNLAYNSSDPIRAIAGSVLAGQVVDALETLAEAQSGPRFNIQFGAYGTFMSLFGLADLTAVSPNFYGICDYASSMVFELSAPNATNFTQDDLSVRFLFSNGSAAYTGLTAYPLFGQQSTTLSWSDFKAGMAKFTVSSTDQWCQICGNTDGSCASNSTSTASSPGSGAKSTSSDGVSKPVAGVIGAFVTLVVVLGVQAAVMLLGGLRLVKKSALVGASAGPAATFVKA